MKQLFNWLYGQKSKLSNAIAYYPKDTQDHAIIALIIVWSSLLVIAGFGLQAGFWYLVAWNVVFILNEVVDHFSDSGEASVKDYFVGLAVTAPMLFILFKTAF